MIGTKIERARKSIVKFIREENLQVNDKLPSHDYLRRHLKLSTATVNSAIQSLRSDGVVEVKNKSGVFLKDPLTNGHICGTIGIAVYDVFQHSAFNNFLINAVNIMLNQNGYQTRFFSISNKKLRTGEYGKDRTCGRNLDDLSGLKRSISAGELEALFSMDDINDESIHFLKEKNIPAIIFSSRSNRPNSLQINLAGFVMNAKKDLIEKGCKRLGLILTHNTLANFTDEIEKLVKNDNDISFEWLPDSATELYEYIMARPEHERPEGIIAPDDVMLHEFILELHAQQNVTYSPWFVSVKNYPIDIDFRLKKQIVYDLNLWKLANFISDNLLNLVKNNLYWESPRLYDIISAKQTGGINAGGE